MMKKEDPQQKEAPKNASQGADRFLIKRPIITEKVTRDVVLRKYAFLVERRATKPEIAKALRAIYKVDPVAVRIVNTRPKTRRLGNSVGVKAGYKKALVTLKEGQKLDILPT